MSHAVLITQCLQRDFVDLVEPHEPLPNKLHVGRSEALRLLGADPHAGPVAQCLHWARSQDPSRLDVIHIRDWHDASDPRQIEHLDMFGHHCVAGARGAALILGMDEGVKDRPNEHLVDAIALNDFEGTTLPLVLDRIRAKAGNELLRVGVIGVWTEAKVSFLLYDLKTRARIDELATCSALTASASRAQHFNALDQLRKILGVTVLDSVGDFGQWLVPESQVEVPQTGAKRYAPSLKLDGQGELDSDKDKEVLAFLYRDSAEVSLKPLSGGFSGALVFETKSKDPLGHEQAPSVAKVGPRAMIGAERAAFERVEEILGNNAPSVRGFVDLADRAGIKFSYAAMGRGDIRTFQSMYQKGLAQEKVDAILSEVFEEILEPFYSAAQFERLPLLEHYTFSPEWADATRERVAGIYGEGGGEDDLLLPGGASGPNPALFYSEYVPRHLGKIGEYHHVSYVHGDLNGANILVDSRDNVWIIDFFHTGRSHVLKDLIKLENDLFYIFTPLSDEAVLEQGVNMMRAVLSVEDLRATLPEQPPEGVREPQLRRAWATLRTLRRMGARYVRSDRNPQQVWIPLLRYAVHTLSFDESSALQKRWALASASLLTGKIMDSARQNQALRIAWLEPGVLHSKGRLGMTLCPGRRDHGRDLDDDLEVVAGETTEKLFGLLTEQELDWMGVPHIAEVAGAKGITYVLHPVPDQGVPSLEEARRWSAEINADLDAGDDVVIHCVGGLGRTGTLAAVVLQDRGFSADDAMARVREARGPRAIESELQERFVREYRTR